MNRTNNHHRHQDASLPRKWIAQQIILGSSRFSLFFCSSSSLFFSVANAFDDDFVRKHTSFIEKCSRRFPFVTIGRCSMNRCVSNICMLFARARWTRVRDERAQLTLNDDFTARSSSLSSDNFLFITFRKLLAPSTRLGKKKERIFSPFSYSLVVPSSSAFLFSSGCSTRRGEKQNRWTCDCWTRKTEAKGTSDIWTVLTPGNVRRSCNACWAFNAESRWQ